MRCKPGDLTVVIKADGKCLERLNMFCEVIRLVRKGEAFPRIQFLYFIEDGWEIRFTDGAIGYWRDDGLFPFRPEPDPLEVNRNEEFTA